MSKSKGLSAEDVFFCQEAARIGNAVLKRINESVARSVVTEAAFALHGKIVDSCNSLMVLAANASHNISFDGAMILRGMYDAMLQCLYILDEPNKREERAHLFMDFFWVEQKRLVDLAEMNPSFVARKVAASPKRPAHEPRLRAEFDRVKKCYQVRKGKLRNTWYEGSLRRLAKEVGYEAEYEMLQQYLSASVHSSAFALKWGDSGIDVRHMITHAWHLSLRVLGRLAEATGVSLTDEERGVMDEMYKSIVG